MPVTTTANYIQDMSAPKAVSQETQEVMNRMAGFRTKWELYSEFFGVTKDNMHDHNALEELGVNYHPKLKELGITEEEFNSFTNNYSPNATKTGATAKDTSDTESESSTTVSTRGRRAKKDTE